MSLEEGGRTEKPEWSLPLHSGPTLLSVETHTNLGTLARCVDDRRVPLFVSGSFLRRIFTSRRKMVSGLVEPGNIVADLGCGPGYFTITLAELVGANGKVYAVDFDRKAIERLERKARKSGLDGTMESKTASAAEVDFIPVESVDFVFAHELLCCMRDHAGALSQIRRILKKKGRAYLSVTKLYRQEDPRAVNADEWKQILERFHVNKSGESLFSRWALISKENGSEHDGPFEKTGAVSVSGCDCF